MSSPSVQRTPPVQSPEDRWREFIAASKKKKGPLYTRYVNRNAAIPFTYLFWIIGLSPNAVSMIGFAVTHIALLVLLLLGVSVAMVLVAWSLLALGYVLDSSDGQLARVSGRTSRLGEWLDHSLDIVKILTVNMTLSYLMISHAAEAGQALALPVLAAVLNVLAQPAHFCSAAVRSLLRPGGAVAEFGERGGAARLLRSVMSIGDYGLFILIILLLPWMQVFTVAYFAYGVFFTLLFVLYFVRSAIQIARIDEG